MTLWESAKSGEEDGYGTMYGTSYGAPELSNNATKEDQEKVDAIYNKLLEMQDEAKSFRRKVKLWRVIAFLMAGSTLGLTLSSCAVI